MSEMTFQVDDVTLTDGMENMYLNFMVGEEVYGIEIRYVLQIVGMQAINEMPEMPPDMKGFINLRGSVIPVISMRLKFRKDEVEYHDRTCIIVVVVNGKETGLIVDAIQETVTIEPQSILPPPNRGDISTGAYVKGIAQLPDERAVVLLNTFNLIAGNNF